MYNVAVDLLRARSWVRIPGPGAWVFSVPVSGSGTRVQGHGCASHSSEGPVSGPKGYSATIEGANIPKRVRKRDGTDADSRPSKRIDLEPIFKIRPLSPTSHAFFPFLSFYQGFFVILSRMPLSREHRCFNPLR